MNSISEEWLNKGVIFLTGDITGETLSYVKEAIMRLLMKVSAPPLTLIISTFGGTCSLEIYDVLRLYPGKKIGLVVNNAKSAGALVLQACDVRLATPHSKILIHHGSTGDVKYDILMDGDKAKRFLLDSRRMIEDRYNIFMLRSGKTRQEISNLCFQDRSLSPEEAIEFGLLDCIWDGPLPISETGLKWS
jgi:ATP-dependent Clp protease protease subunit